MKKGLILIHVAALSFTFIFLLYIYSPKRLFSFSKNLKKIISIKLSPENVEFFIKTSQQISRRFQSACLVSSLVIFCGIKGRSRLCLGVQPKPFFRAHAWVFLNNKIYNMDESVKYKTLFEYEC